MKKNSLRKRPFIIASLIAIFSFTGFVYAKKASTLLGSETTHLAQAKTDETESMGNPERADVQEASEAQQEIAEPTPSQQQEGTQEPNEESSQQEADQAGQPQPTPESTGIIASVAKAITDTLSSNTATAAADASKHPLHTNISATLFWAGEEAGEDNQDISNLPSAWDEEWVKRFGGVDHPKKRTGYFPSKFTPKENPFYFALPYNDFDENGKRKKEVSKIVDWAGKREWKSDESILKNQWIKIIKDGKVAYAQWEDVGPFKEDDANYVFGTATPKSKVNKNAGLDVSPAVHDFLGLEDIDTVDWQFVNPDQVPDGPWKTVVTTSQVNWK
jgi:hypothetical protein